MGVPELTRYTDVENPLDSSLEGSYPFEQEEEWDGHESEIIKNVESMTSIAPVKAKSLKTKRVVARRITVSSSDSECDIKEVLNEVVRDYTATHSRSARHTKFSGIIKEDKVGCDLISLD